MLCPLACHVSPTCAPCCSHLCAVLHPLVCHVTLLMCHVTLLMCHVTPTDLCFMLCSLLYHVDPNCVSCCTHLCTMLCHLVCHVVPTIRLTINKIDFIMDASLNLIVYWIVKLHQLSVCLIVGVSCDLCLRSGQ